MRRKFDLNLLPLLVAVADAESVSIAARKLGMTQSGMSTALARARDLLGDELFLRSARGVRPTARAARAVETAKTVLKLIDSGVLEAPEFDAANSHAEFRLAMQDVSEALFFPAILAQARRTAPRVAFSSEDVNATDLERALASGIVDLALGYFPGLDAQAIASERLGVHTYACLLRRDHPSVGRDFDLRTYRALDHVVAESPATVKGALNKALAARRVVRNVAMRVLRPMAVPAIVEKSDLLGTVPVAVAEYFARRGTLAVLPLPLAPVWIEIRQYWHRGNQREPRNRWLRRQVSACFKDLAEPWRAMEDSLYGRRQSRRARPD